jgi:hypothetical protein
VPKNDHQYQLHREHASEDTGHKNDKNIEKVQNLSQNRQTINRIYRGRQLGGGREGGHRINSMFKKLIVSWEIDFTPLDTPSFSVQIFYVGHKGAAFKATGFLLANLPFQYRLPSQA